MPRRQCLTVSKHVVTEQSQHIPERRAVTRRWLITLIGWDGLLPVMAALLPLLVKWTLPQGHIAEVVVAVIVPCGLALVRAALAHRALSRDFAASPPALRQGAIALAIILLCLTEVMFSVKVFAPDAPVLPLAVLSWFMYFTVMGAATFPPTKAQLAEMGG